MSNRKRIILQEVTYHCFSRCHGKHNFFKSAHAKQFLIAAINKCLEKYTFKLIAAEPVGNHIHIIIKTIENKETISRIMQYIKARIAEYYNRALNRTGAFWNERYGCTIIEHSNDPQNDLLWLLWYIGYDPVRRGLSKNPRTNDIGFINCYLNKDYKCKVPITLHDFFTNLSDNFEQCVERFLYHENLIKNQLLI